MARTFDEVLDGVHAYLREYVYFRPEDIGKLGEDDDLADLDSLDVEEMALFLEDRFDVDLEGVDRGKMTSTRDVAKAIKEILDDV